MALRGCGRWALRASALRGGGSGRRHRGHGTDTPQHGALRAALRKIIDREINPFVDKWEEEGQFPAHKVFKTLGQAGFLGVDKPTGRQMNGQQHGSSLLFCGGQQEAIS